VADFHPFRSVPRTGVIFVSEEAAKRGFSPGDPKWCNLGQGQPESGALPGAPSRPSTLALHENDFEYAPVGGLRALREAVAHLYNTIYRKDSASKYTAENVAIAGGGRVALTRVLSAIGQVNVGHFLPDYTAYEELLDVFRAFHPTPIMLEPSDAYAFDARALEREIMGRGLGLVLLSNPSNPTGHVIQGSALAEYVRVARETGCALLADEFYGNYIYAPDGRTTTVSAAEFVQDVDKDPVVILNGLTKGWRFPGWRVSWVVGPKSLIEAVNSAGSFLDGGGARPLQRAAIDLVSPERFLQETEVVQKVFREKRDMVLASLKAMGIRVEAPPEGTFYVWASLADLPPPLNDGMGMFRAALEKNVILIPGEFFDVNPGKRRNRRRFQQYVRISFGPAKAELERGLSALAELIRETKA
jgi:N-succinyldiaminopimelate aminotransferase